MRTGLLTSTLLLTSILASASTSAAADLAKGKTLFAERCAMCHGAEGLGDGPASAAFPPDQKPRNFQSGEYKYAKDDAKFKELLQKGGGAVGLSMLMPPQSDLKDADLDSIVAFVKTLHK